MTADPATHSSNFAHHSMHLLPDTRNGGPRRPHLGDILYWVACLGGVCLLLFMAT